MKYFYRITKYFNYLSNGHLSDDGWSSFSDVGKKISFEQYLEIEKQYIDTILAICKYNNIGYLKISKLWTNTKTYNLKNKDLISIKDLPNIISCILREDIWCKLVHRKCQFHFGYDFYMYCISQQDLFEFLKNNSKLNIEKYKSPYYRRNNL